MIKRIIIIIFLIVCLGCNIHAYEINVNEYITEEMQEYLPQDILTDDEDKGSIINYKEIASYIIELLKSSVAAVLENFFVILSLVIISACLGMLSNMLKSESTRKVFSYITSICFAALLYSILNSMWQEILYLFEDINSLMNGITPAISVLYAAGGNITTSAVSQAGMSIMLTVFQKICYYGITPILQICFGFSIVSCMSGSVNLGPIAKFVRSTYTTVLVFVISLMTCIMSMQNMLSQANDSLAMRTLRFASSSAVPLVGGALGEATSGIASGIGVIKTTFGILAIIALGIMVLPVLLNLWVNKLAFSLGGTICSIFGIDRESALVGTASELINFALAITISVTVMFVINIMLFSHATVAIGG